MIYVIYRLNLFMQSLKKSNFNFYIIFIILFSNFFFGWGFQNTTILSIPILYFFLAILIFNSSLKTNLNILNYLKILNIYSLYIFFFVSKIIIGFFKFGIIAIRDGTFILDSFFLIVLIGLAYQNMDYINKIEKFFKFCFLYSFFFILFWFIKENIIFLSPTIESPTGSKTNIFFNFSTINTTCAFFAFYSLIYLNKNNNLFFIFFLIFSIILVPKRMVYLWYLSSFIFLIFIDSRNFKLFFKIFFLLFLIYILDIFGLTSFLNIKNISIFEFLNNHIMSSIPGHILENENEIFISTNATINWRLNEWLNVLQKVQSNIYTLLLGLDFGIPLTNFYNSQGIITREPHNLYISILARGGIIGSFLFLVLHFKILKILFSFFRENYKSNNKQINSLFLLVFIYVIFIFIASGVSTSILSATYYSSQLYIFFGILLAINTQRKINKI